MVVLVPATDPIQNPWLFSSIQPANLYQFKLKKKKKKKKKTTNIRDLTSTIQSKINEIDQ
jgi:hypothetical protein